MYSQFLSPWLGSHVQYFFGIRIEVAFVHKRNQTIPTHDVAQDFCIKTEELGLIFPVDLAIGEVPIRGFFPPFGRVFVDFCFATVEHHHFRGGNVGIWPIG
jgi:hypothetical protein